MQFSLQCQSLISKSKKYTQFKSTSSSWLGHKQRKIFGLSKIQSVALLPFMKSLTHKTVRASNMSAGALLMVLAYLDNRYFYSMLRTMAVTAVEEVGFNNPMCTMLVLKELRACDGVFDLSVNGYQNPLMVWKIMKRLWPHFSSLIAQLPPPLSSVHRFTGEKIMIALKRYETGYAKYKKNSQVNKPVVLGKTQTAAQKISERVYGNVPTTPLAFLPFVSAEVRNETTTSFIKRCHDTSHNIDSFIAKTKARVIKHGLYTKKYYIAIEELFEAMAPALSVRLTKPFMVEHIFNMLLKHSDRENIQNILTCKAFYYMQLKRNKEITECVMYVAMAAQLATAPAAQLTNIKPQQAPPFSYVEHAFSQVISNEHVHHSQESVKNELNRVLKLFDNELHEIGKITMDMHVIHSGHKRDDAGLSFFMNHSGRLYKKNELCRELWAW